MTLARQCRQSGRLWEDPAFPANSKVLTDGNMIVSYFGRRQVAPLDFIIAIIINIGVVIIAFIIIINMVIFTIINIIRVVIIAIIKVVIIAIIIIIRVVIIAIIIIRVIMINIILFRSGTTRSSGCALETFAKP